MVIRYNSKTGKWEEAEPIPYYRPYLAKRIMQPIQTYEEWFNTLSYKQKKDLEENCFEILVLDKYGNPALRKWLKQPHTTKE